MHISEVIINLYTKYGGSKSVLSFYYSNIYPDNYELAKTVSENTCTLIDNYLNENEKCKKDLIMKELKYNISNELKSIK